MSTLYFVTTAPLSETGATQLMTTELTSVTVEGAIGCAGSMAHLIETGSDNSL
jgi:hypothetical protein